MVLQQSLGECEVHIKSSQLFKNNMICAIVLIFLFNIYDNVFKFRGIKEYLSIPRKII